MKNVFAFCLAAFISQVAFSQKCRLKEVWELDPETNEVFRKTFYTYNKSGQLESWSDSGDYVVNCKAFYAENGDFHYYNEGSDGFIHFTHWYNYLNGQLIEIEDRNDFDVTVGITRYKYDNEKRLIKLSQYSVELFDTLLTWEAVYYYENKSSKNPFSEVEFSEFSRDSALVKYDDKKNPYSLLGGPIVAWEQNNLLNFDVVGEDGAILPELSINYKYTYNKHGLPEMKIPTDGSGNFQPANKFIYECK